MNIQTPEGVIDWACAHQRDRTPITNSNRLIYIIKVEIHIENVWKQW